ncbi:DinB family protein [Amycolatopsis sp. GM8]|uniref:DinB family protein n=1 Tax=Amycolatopsis sp. GM8 TaxID=2896530 RepID=UPI001F1C5050|nr:DinB family protein [Amycolatopsis sp. GM8]
MSSRDDILELFNYCWQRFRARMAGLTDDEWRWQPTADDRLTLRWRLAHIAELLREERNARWLGLPPSLVPVPEMSDAATALAAVESAFAVWRGYLASMTEEDFGAPIGRPAGRYGDATRRSFALHIVDELIHHTAEAALLRDLYA